MTILCLVLNKKDRSWAAFADSLITSNFTDEGIALSTPLRPFYGKKRVFGFSEVALEEKLGFIDKDTILGWSGERAEAIRALAEFKLRNSHDEFVQIFAKNKNHYLLARQKGDGGNTLTFLGPKDSLHTIDSGDYEFHFAGSGGRIMQGFRFTAHHQPLGLNAPHVVFAALSAMCRFLSEDMAGRDSQFYSLRTGGHYRVFYGSPTGIRQLYFAINHWIINSENEPVVPSIVLPFISGRHECSVEVRVETGWSMQISNAIGLAPLLESPRTSEKFEVNLPDLLTSELAHFTVHICWRADAHKTFITNVQEPKFDSQAGQFTRKPYQDETLEMVRNFLFD